MNTEKINKISILTFSKGDNYGAVLQAYALGEVLRKRGYKVEFIYLTWSTWKHELLSHITPLNFRFERFRKNYLRDFSKECRTIEDLEKATEDSDLCIVGSDQVWNPDITTIRAKHYFFDFISRDIPLISYAASFGVNKWKWPEIKDEISHLLKRFHYVSVREDSGVDILSKEFGVKAQKVLDPTLLLGDFSSLVLSKRPGKEYVLGYKFVTSPEYYNLVSYVSKELGCQGKIMDMFPRDIKYVKGLKKSYCPSPQQWITNIANSKFIITDSFHTMAFAIMFKINFLVIPSSKLAQLQGRMKSLLTDLGLEDRIFSSIEEAKNSRIWERKIDFDNVDLKLKTLREESMQFISKALTLS